MFSIFSAATYSPCASLNMACIHQGLAFVGCRRLEVQFAVTQVWLGKGEALNLAGCSKKRIRTDYSHGSISLLVWTINRHYKYGYMEMIDFTFFLSIILRRPPESHSPMSPVWNHLHDGVSKLIGLCPSGCRQMCMSPFYSRKSQGFRYIKIHYIYTTI